MKELVESILENLSSREVFLIRVCCSGCGAEYGNKPRRFSKAGVEPENGNRQVIFDVLYEQELRLARQFAIRDAAEHMNYCPVCKRLVCNGCFLICDELDLCRECARKLGQTRKSVLHDIVEEAVS